MPQGESPGAWPLTGDFRHSKAWLEPVHEYLSDSLGFPAMPALSRQSSQVPLLQLHKLAPQARILVHVFSHNFLTMSSLLLQDLMQPQQAVDPTAPLSAWQRGAERSA